MGLLDKSAKSVSGKRGTLLQVANDPNYGKDTRGEAKDRVFFNAKGETVNGGESMKKQLEQDKERLDKQAAERYDKAVSYNLNLPNLEKEYTELSLSPGTVVVRLIRKDISQTASGLYLPNQRLHNPLKSGLKGTSDTDTSEHPYPFYPFGIVVNMSKELEGTWEDLKVGSWVKVDNRAMNVFFDEPNREYIVPNALVKFGDSRPIKETGYLRIKRHEVVYVDNNFDITTADIDGVN